MIFSAIDTLWRTPIHELCINDSGFRQMLRLMDINLYERITGLNMVGCSATGHSRNLSPQVSRFNYSYSRNNNYLNYQVGANETELTVKGIPNENINRYNGGGKRPFNNNVYKETWNLYPDQYNVGNQDFYDEKKWVTNNVNSLLKKTKDLFNQNKIKTIVDSFHTDPTDMQLYDNNENASKYGLSHGRNLLTYEAENYNNAYDVNGYENPYCRVWTHHHQYNDFRTRLIRPFIEPSESDEEAIAKDTISLHEWGDDLWQQDENGDVFEKWGWKDSKTGAKGFSKSVLNHKTGFLNIAPQFKGGAGKNIHTKDCMFSIENLAWRDYDPYSFEKALSWEQRGPFGGRIMWFPPYGLHFTEDSSVNWSEHSFIGRGENVFTYTNTTRSGSLEFMMVVDHPSIIDYATWNEERSQNLRDTDILRFFAGCEGGSGKIKSSDDIFGGDQNNNNRMGDINQLKNFTVPTPLTDEYLIHDEEVPAITIKPMDPPIPDEVVTLEFYVFYPNNYSGYFDRKGNEVEPIGYLLAGKGSQWVCDESDVTKSKNIPISFKNLDKVPSSNKGHGYEMGKEDGICNDNQELKKNFIAGADKRWCKNCKTYKYKPHKTRKWFYRIDGIYKREDNVKGKDFYLNTFDQNIDGYKNKGLANYKDSKSFQLNCNASQVKKAFSTDEKSEVYSLAEIAYALSDNFENNEETALQKEINKYVDKPYTKDDERIKYLLDILNPNTENPYKIKTINSVGFSNSHGSNVSQTMNKNRNWYLSHSRAETALQWFMQYYKGNKNDIETSEDERSSVLVDKHKQDKDVNSLEAKKYRSARVKISFVRSQKKDIDQLNNELYKIKEEKESYSEITGFKHVGSTVKDGKTYQLYENLNEIDKVKKGEKWYYDDAKQQMIKFEKMKVVTNRFDVDGVPSQVTPENRKAYEEALKNHNMHANNIKRDSNTYRYDQEYYFFKQLEVRDPAVFSSLMDKIKYFDPAFHSMTPEGFMGRLTFLNQCTRQGDTRTISDKDGYMANNLAFGRPPFCILRLGDFYYQTIVIRNISISYDPLVLDLNPEGVGVVPLIANVNISFNFVGGGDLTGPVRRLQNAMSFNYYANTRLYDNRADRVEYEDTNWETMGAMGNHKIDFNNSTFNNIQKEKKK